jgi:hypothetical protein
MAALAGTALAPEVGETVRDAQEKLRRAAQVANLTGDPLGPVIEAQVAFLGAQHRMFAEAKRPVDEDAMMRAVAQGISGHAANAVRTMGWRNMMIGAAILVASIVGGAGGGYWFRGAVPILVGVHAGAEACEDRTDGSRLCWIPVLERLPRAK